MPAMAVDCNEAEITLNTQAEVDSFQTAYGPGCDTVLNGLTIDGASITSLTPLAGLTAVSTAGPWRSSTHKLQINNTSLTSLAGLESLANVWWIELNNNTLLIDISALSGLTLVRGPLFIDGSTTLTNLNGLHNLTALNGGALFIQNNASLTDLSGVSNITTINASLVISNNDALVNLDAFLGLSTVNSNISISQNNLLNDISGLSGLVGFTDTLYVRYSNGLVQLGSLPNLVNLNGLVIYANPVLQNLDGLENVTTIGNNTALAISYNNVLSDIDALSNLVSAEWQVQVNDNPQLTECSALQTLLDSVDDGLPGPGPNADGIPDVADEVTVEDNGEGCNSIADITGELPPPPFDLMPNFGGMDNYFGAFSQVSCDWVPGESLEFWWDDPEVLLGNTMVDEDGCFEAFIRLDSEKISGAAIDTHVIEARGASSGVSRQNFRLVEPQLNLSPHTGAPGRSVDVTGCNWDGAAEVSITWLGESIDLGTHVIDGFGCLDTTVQIPEVKDGIYSILGESDTALVTWTAFQVRSPEAVLFPPESMPGATIVVAGCNWFADEIVEFEFLGEDGVFSLVDTNGDGCLYNKMGGAPFIDIPGSATLGEKTLSARGQLSGLVVDQLFVVLEPTLLFTPDIGSIGDPITVSGCGWSDNETVTVTWSHNDHNNHPITWNANVDLTTGCFGQGGEMIINIPTGSNTGELELTAEGDLRGQADEILTVNHNGIFYAPDPDAYAGYAVTLKFETDVFPESIEIQAGGSPATRQYVTVTAGEFTFDYTLPTSYNVGNDRTLHATGSKGFQATTKINILDNAEISVSDPGNVKNDRSLRVEGQNWGSYEDIQFKLIQGVNEIFLSPAEEVAAGEIDFIHYLDIPSSIPPGDYLLLAEGTKGRDAELELSIIDADATAFTLGAPYADLPPDLDGVLSPGEWDLAQKVDLPNGFISARSDDTRLYVLLNMLGDDSEQSPGEDNFWLTFDTNRNTVIDTGIDLNFRLQGNDLVWEAYTGPNSFNTLNSDFLPSAWAAGFDCFSADDSARLEFSGPNWQFICEKHRVFEIGIDLHSINAQPGEPVRIGVRAQSQSPAFSDDLPTDFASDFSELGTILLADSRVDPASPAGNLTGIGSNGFKIEITQAIQDVNNDVRLVASKDTVARVYPQVDGDALLRTFLFGSRNDVDLPGSPLVSLGVTPDDIDRDSLADTANFLLPESWLAPGTLELAAFVEMPDGSPFQIYIEQINLHERRVPEIWVYPFNLGDAINPVLPRDAHMKEQEQVLERMIPVPEVDFVRRDWTELNQNLPTVSCPDVDSVGNMDDFLDPGEVMVCGHLYTIKQLDMDEGEFSRSAFAAGDYGETRSARARHTVDGPEESSASAAANRAPASNRSGQSTHDGKLELLISADASGFNDVGDKIQYEFEVTNTGTDPVSGPITVADSEVGLNFNTMKIKLRERWNAIYQSLAMTNDTDQMPDQLYGFKVFGDPDASGTSDPVWLGRGGRVIVGRANGSNFDSQTMVHELNHNLDRSTSGTWGRHVGDPDSDKNDSAWGCGAGGTDPAWPWTGDDSIQLTGFDTSLPWDDGSVDHLTVIPFSRDDTMSYCTDDDLPIAWISPYRWEAMFGVYTTAIPFRLQQVSGIGDVFYISGQVNDDGSGSLEPVFTLPGIQELSQVPGDYSIELQDGGGGALYSMSFPAFLTGVEGETLETVAFSYQLPYQAGVERIVLKMGGSTLHTIEATPNAPSVNITAPSGGESLKGEEDIIWTANDLDGDNLQFSLFYTPDGGIGWHPVVSRLNSSPYIVNVANLPGGNQGKFRLVASDGLNTVVVDSSGFFEVPKPAPTIVIDAPTDGSELKPDQWVQLRGSASLPTGPADGVTLAWLVDGAFAAAGDEHRIALQEGPHTITLLGFDDAGNAIESSVAVTVKENDPPNEPRQPFPADEEVNVLRDVVLSWIGGDIDADEVSYEVYLSAGIPQAVDLVCDDVTVSECAPHFLLDADTLYYWHVVARDEEGETAESDTWQFDTGALDSTELIYADSFE